MKSYSFLKIYFLFLIIITTPVLAENIQKHVLVKGSTTNGLTQGDPIENTGNYFVVKSEVSIANLVSDTELKDEYVLPSECPALYLQLFVDGTFIERIGPVQYYEFYENHDLQTNPPSFIPIYKASVEFDIPKVNICGSAACIDNQVISKPVRLELVAKKGSNYILYGQALDSLVQSSNCTGDDLFPYVVFDHHTDEDFFDQTLYFKYNSANPSKSTTIVDGKEVQVEINEITPHSEPHVDEISSSDVGSEVFVHTENNMTAVPNPFVNQLNLQYILAQDGQIRLSIFNSSGQLITQLNSNQPKGQKQYTINTEEWVRGVYWVQLQTTKGKSAIKVIKQ